MIDACAFVGHWPFRRLRRAGLSDLVSSNERNGIERAIISCLDSIFYNDPMEGDASLAKALPGRYALALSHNPLLPHAAREVLRNPLRAAMVRLYPGYHGYALDDPSVLPFCRAAAQAGLIICVVYKLEDLRLDYLVRQSPPSLESILTLAASVPEGRFVLSGYAVADAIEEGQALCGLPNLWLDSAYCGNLTFPYERLCAALPKEKLLFATHQPLLCPETNVLAIRRAALPDDVKRAVTQTNAQALLAE